MAAQRIVQALASVPVEHLDDGSAPSTPDFQIRWGNGPPSPLEVVMDTSSALRGMIYALRKYGNTATTTATRLRWVVSLLERGSESKASIKETLRELPGYLAAVEKELIPEFTRMAGFFSAAVGDVISRFPIWRGRAVLTEEQPRLVLEAPKWGPAAGHSAEVVNRIVSDFAWAEDNRKKLRGKDRGAEAHLFIWMDRDANGRGALMIEDFPPMTEPELPPEVDCVWAAASDPAGDVIWFCRQGFGWDFLRGKRQLWPGEREPSASIIRRPSE
jgi:hypothetical protein